ncbi:hypothetical protein [Streptomyces lavendulae]|uniref:hypothetical protein n=1 Tax=Streptomyces lavendulae TaxID=1914 RepID=UPI003400BCF9
MGLLEGREAAARVRVEELRAEAERVLAELGAAEVVWERRVIARAELGEALAVGSDAVVVPAAEAPDPAQTEVKEREVPVAGSVVRRCGEGMTVRALARITGGSSSWWSPSRAVVRGYRRRSWRPGWGWSWCRRRSRQSAPGRSAWSNAVG